MFKYIITPFENVVATTEQKIGNNAASIVYILTATSTYVLMLAWCKTHVEEITPIQAQFLRGVLMTLIIYFYSRYNGIPLTVENGRQDKLRIIRNIIGSLFHMTSFFIVTKVPISTILIIQSSNPFIIAFIDHIVHKTTYTKIEVIFSFVSVTGVAFMIKPDLFFDIEATQQVSYTYAEGSERVFWIILFVIVTIFWSGSIVMLKALKNVNTMAMNIPFGIALAASSPLIEIAYEQVKDISMGIYLQAIFFVGIISFINQHAYVKANQIGKPAKLAILYNMNIVLSFLFEILYLKEHREWHSFVGATIIVGSSIILSISRL